MRVVICGMGFVGSVTAACLLEDKHEVVAVDVNPRVLERISSGQSPVGEPAVADAFAKGRSTDRLIVSRDLAEVKHADIAMVCVGTDEADGALKLDHLEAAVREIGRRIIERPGDADPLLIVIRSTILPGTTAQVVLPTLADIVGRGPGTSYDVVYNPEFMREGVGVADFRAPARIVIGGSAEASAPLRRLYQHIQAPIFHTSFEAAEAIKFADNAFHALKVAFANEIGRFAVSHQIDVEEFAQLFVADTKLNISDKYLRPGLSFGGPCLPKDVGALVGHMHRHAIDAPLISALLSSNRSHEDFHVGRIRSRISPGEKILLRGITFKAGSADLRGSPLVSIVRRLAAEGYVVDIYDPDVPAHEIRTLLPGHLVLDELHAGIDWQLVVDGKPQVDDHQAIRAVARLALHQLD